jgi:putative DNA primase/helicase
VIDIAAICRLQTCGVDVNSGDLRRVTEPLEWALRYVARGWAVLPNYTVDADGVCTCSKREQCPNPGKHPRLDVGVKGSSTQPATIRRWLERQWPGRCNLGIATGQVSGLVVIDVDPRHGGLKTLAALERELGPLPTDTPRVRTGSGGLHVYLAYPTDGSSIRNSEGLLGPGIDVRGDGGYVLCPPSRTNKGLYQWLT